MPFYIQDPSGEHCKLLHDSILTEANKASEGGGAFAFATKGGIELLFNSAEFKELLRKGRYTLIVGMDGITDTSAIETLKYYRDVHENLTVKAFYHEESGVIFHPKFSWFRNSVEPDEGTLITGSGNLTPRGLRNNWEAYYISTLVAEQFKRTYDTWNNWLLTHQQFLLELEHEDVVEKAENNRKEFKSSFAKKVENKREKSTSKKNKTKPKILLGDLVLNSNQYLLLEVPVGRTRGTPSAYTQANLGKPVFEKFFNIDIDALPNSFYFQHVTGNGITGCLEQTRPIIKKASSNYNFKLEATDGKGKPEPVTPPICIFVELGARTYRYRFLLPGEETYDELRRYLHSQPSISTGLRKYIGDQDELFSVIPTSPYLSSLLANDT